MLQRIQTLFIVIAVISLCLVFAFPVWKGVFSVGTETKEATYNVMVEGLKISNIIVLANLVVCLGMALGALFMYKKRTLQMKLVALNVFFIALLMGFFFLNIESMTTLFGTANKDSEGYKLAFFLPIIALLLHVVAYRFIKKDEALVRSVDRIR